MNAENKLEHQDKIIKNMTRICHKRCFVMTDNKYNLDKNCLSSCYHKYINTISKLTNLSLNLGKKYESEFITSVYNTKDDPLMDLIWSKGGSKLVPIPSIGLSLKHMTNLKVTPYKGFSPYRDEMDNQ